MSTSSLTVQKLDYVNIGLLLFSSMIVIALFVQQGCYLRVHFLIGITLYIY